MGEEPKKEAGPEPAKLSSLQEAKPAQVEDAKVEGAADPSSFIHIKWQSGPVVDGKPNGVQIEEVLRTCLLRLEGFQSSPLACRENAKAIAYLTQSLNWLNERTRLRKAQGVEGTMKPHASNSPSTGEAPVGESK